MWARKGPAFLAATATKDAKSNLADSFKLPPEVRNKLQDEFNAVDIDGSGALDAGELSGLFSRLALHVSATVRCPTLATRRPSCSSFAYSAVRTFVP